MRAVLAIAAAVGLASCEPAGDTQLAKANGYNMPVWTDPVTGCDYIAPTGIQSYGVMPRISADGYTVYCADQKAGRVSSEPNL